MGRIFSELAAPGFRRSLGEIALVGILALTTVAVDIYFSAQVGLLAYPPYYDGIGYVLGAKSLFYRLNPWWFNLWGSAHTVLNSIVPLWSLLIMLSFSLLGQGEWQAYAVRFWPTFLLLLLMFWVVRRRASQQVAWAAVVFTALLPTVSVGLRGSLSQYFAGLSSPVRISGPSFQFYLADLRPDLLFAVLLVWAIVPVIDHLYELDRRMWLLSGTFAGLAVLVKSSGSPLLLFAWLSTLICVLIVNRGQLRRTLLTALWSAIPFAILITPWVRYEGAMLTYQYLYVNFIGTERAVYATPNLNLVSMATFYWRLFQGHMGYVEGWVMLAAGLGASILLFVRKTLGRRDVRLMALLGVSIVLYALVSASPNRNYFLGLPYYLVLWAFSWSALSSVVKRRVGRHYWISWALLLIVCTYTGIQAAGASYSVENWPSQSRLAIQENRQVVQEIAADLRAILTNNDTFMWAPAYGFPAALQYYMVDDKGGYPQTIWVDIEKPPYQVIRESVSSCKAILAYEEEFGLVATVFNVPPVVQPYFRAIAEWVKQSNSSYVPVKTYHFITQDGRLTMHLYVRGSNLGQVASQNTVIAQARSGWDCCHREIGRTQISVSLLPYVYVSFAGPSMIVRHTIDKPNRLY